jgi:hypothetical protein
MSDLAKLIEVARKLIVSSTEMLHAATHLGSAASKSNWKDCHFGSCPKAREVIALMDEQQPAQSIEDFWREQSAWSQATFGTDSERGPAGPLKHLLKEAKEALASPDDLEEYVDCLFLVIDATRRAGFSYRQLLDGAWKKLEVNKSREWPKLGSEDAVEHVREQPAQKWEPKVGEWFHCESEGTFQYFRTPMPGVLESTKGILYKAEFCRPVPPPQEQPRENPWPDIILSDVPGALNALATRTETLRKEG